MKEAERLQQILDLLASYAWSITLLEIGQGVGLAKGDHLRRLVKKLMDQGLVQREMGDHPKYGPTWFYFLKGDRS